MKATISGVKQRARLLKSHLESSGIEITLTKALEAVSASENGSDWNRYSAALKSARTGASAAPNASEYPPHKILATGPGFGSSAIAECVFAHNIIAGRVPVIVMLHAYQFPTNAQANTEGWVTVEVSYSSDRKTNVQSLSDLDDIKGIIIRPGFDRMQQNGLASAFSLPEDDQVPITPEDRLKVVMQILRDTEKWPAALKRKIGTIILYGTESIDHENTRAYSEFFPKYMEAMREEGGNQELFIVTFTDVMKNDILASRAEYKLIIGEGIAGTLFPRFPIDKLIIEQSSELLTKRLGSLFINRSRAIEDICIYAGSLSTNVINAELNLNSKFHEQIRLYLQQIIGSSIVRQIKSATALE